MATTSPRPRSKMRSEVSARTHAKIRKSELDLEKECSRLEQQMVNRLVDKEREIQKYISESQNQHLKTHFTSGRGSTDRESSSLGPPSRPRSASIGTVNLQRNGDTAKPHSRAASVSRFPQPPVNKRSPVVIPRILVDDDVDEQTDKESRGRSLISSSPAITGNSLGSNLSSPESTPSCSPASSPLVGSKKLHSSSTDALIYRASTSNNLEPLQRERAKSASSPRALDRSKSLPVDSSDIPDKKTLLEMAKFFPDMKGKDGFKQFYQTSSPKPKRR